MIVDQIGAVRVLGRVDCQMIGKDHRIDLGGKGSYVVIQRWLVDFDAIPAWVRSINGVDLFSFKDCFNVTEVVRFIGAFKSRHK